MSLATGTRLNTYEILAPLGAGGMGEVYRARDTRLDRDVALKLVLEAFVAEPDRAMRFEREAKTLASLNHPGIAALYGLEQADGRHFLVMELVEGETLAERIARRPAGIPLEQALESARQIAEALEAAHEKGIIHRDLKPANVKVTPDEKVKVLDFGLARITERPDASSSVSLAHSPTFTSPAMTNAGVILGTASYMSPEQARGYAADHRSDIFSFGVVLYEMLTGRQPFPGETISDVLASVLARDPDLSALPPDLSPRLIDLVKRCLEKNPKKRWQAIGDVRYEIESLLSNPRAVATTAAAAAPVPPRLLWRRVLPFAVTALGAAGLVGVLAWLGRPVAEPPTVTRFTIVPPDGKDLPPGIIQGLAVTADGGRIAFVADQPRQLYVRSMSQLDAVRVVPPSAAAINHLAFSPDGQSLAYWTQGVILRVPASGGPPVTVCQTGTTPFGLTWIGDVLLYAHGQTIFRVAAIGGEPERLIELPKGETPFRPQLLPDGRTLLFTVFPFEGPDRFERGTLVAQRIGESTRTAILAPAVDSRFVAPRYVVFVREGVLLAVAFDPSNLKIFGSPVPVVEGVRRSGRSAQFTIGASGVLAYVEGPAVSTSLEAQQSLVIADRSGGREFLKLAPANVSEPRLARDGRTIAFVRTEKDEANIWVYDLKGTGAARRLTFGGKDRSPVWSADSTRVTFQSEREGDAAIYWQRADGSSAAERLTKPDADVQHVPLSWSPDGAVLLYESVKGVESSLMAWRARDKSAAPFGGVRSAAPTGAVFSPDGRWVAYSTRSGEGSALRNAVMVQPFPATGALFQISRSVEVAHHPVWSWKGTEVLYNPGQDGPLMSVPLTLSPTFAPGEPLTLPRRFVDHSPLLPRPFDQMPDGRMLSFTPDPRPETPGAASAGQPPAKPTEIRIVLNWIEELKAKVR